MAGQWRKDSDSFVGGKRKPKNTSCFGDYKAMTNYAEKLISRHDAKIQKLSGEYRCSQHAHPVTVIDDNGLGQLLVQWPDGNVKEAAKDWFVKRFEPIL
jgi:hypothetical protein